MQNSRDAILNAAEARLLSDGPAGLVLDAIAADAGLSKGGLLYHFPSKEALVAGLCERMLDGFDRQLEMLCEIEDDPVGAWSRAYLDSTVSAAGKPADNSAQLMAGILSTLGRDSVHLDAVRARFATWHKRLEDDGIDRTTAAIVRLAADGLWLSALLGLPTLDPADGPAVVRALRDLTRR